MVYEQTFLLADFGKNRRKKSRHSSLNSQLIVGDEVIHTSSNCDNTHFSMKSLKANISFLLKDLDDVLYPTPLYQKS